MEVNLKLDKITALAVLGAVDDSALSWRMQAAISTGDEKAYAEAKARYLAAVSREITDTLYPEPETIHPAVARANFERWATGS